MARVEFLNSGDLDLYKVSLSRLTFEAHRLVCCLLDTKKILFSEEKLPRDWRGIASLINISAEIANSFETDKTEKVLRYWIKSETDKATVGRLLDFVQKLDRYDIFDDLMGLEQERRLLVDQPFRGPPCNIVATPAGQEIELWTCEDPEENIITFDDKIHGRPQFYHAYVLYAMEDKMFVDEMFSKMTEKGFRLCSEEDILPDHATPYAPVVRLISSDRCHKIILVYSPDFLTSAANKFYMDYAQAVDISKMKKPKIVPCMYRTCQLPPQMTFYHKLYYNVPGFKNSYDFWERLAVSLDVRTYDPRPRIEGYTSSSMSHSGVNIQEMSTSSILPQAAGLLAITAGPHKNSLLSIDNYSTQNSTSTLNSRAEKKKKRKTTQVKKFFSGILLTKKKDKIPV